MNNKKGQLTIFIIIGLVLLVGAILTIYLTTRSQEISIVPTGIAPEVRPVYEFVASCLDDISKRGLHLMGQQGGYIYFPQEIERVPASYLSLDGAGLMKIPYWYYEGEDRTPTINQMQDDVSRYVITNINDCAQNFTTFETEVTPLETPSAETTFGSNDVVVKLTWPLRINLGERETEQSEFAITLPVKIRKIWETASATLRKENEELFFEQLTIDFLTTHPDIPTDGMEMSCGTKRWNLEEIKNTLSTTLSYNIPRIRVAGTDIPPYLEQERNYEQLRQESERINRELNVDGDIKNEVYTREIIPPEHKPADAFEYFRMTIRPNVFTQDVKAVFSYQPEWGMHINALPNDAGVLNSNKVEGAAKYLKFLCINQWHFAYDVIYPVQMILRDENAYQGRGYNFQMAFPVLIDNNKGNRINFGTRSFITPDTDIDFCRNTQDSSVDIRVLGAVDTSGFLSELEGANITYQCIIKNCDLGQTREDGTNYRLRTFLPKGCSNPTITISKAGYLTTSKILTDEKILEIEMPRLKEFDLDIEKYPYISSQEELIDPTRLLGTEEAYIRLTEKQTGYEQIISYPNTTKINLVEDDVEYELEVLLTQNENFIGGYRSDVKLDVNDVLEGDTFILKIFEYRPTPTAQDEKFISYYYGAPYKDELKPVIQ